MNINKNFGKLNLILGCMFSGKTSTLISRYNRYSIGNKKCLLVKYKGDNRYDDNKIVTHDGIKVKAVVCEYLYEVDEIVNKYQVVCIDEIQFYPDADIFCDKWANEGLIVEACGLNGKYDRTEFRIISKLIPLADDITFIKAICRETGNDGIYSKLLTNETGDIVIGGSDKYSAVDRKTFFEEKNSIEKYYVDNFINFIKIHPNKNLLKDKSQTIKYLNLLRYKINSKQSINFQSIITNFTIEEKKIDL